MEMRVDSLAAFLKAARFRTDFEVTNQNSVRYCGCVTWAGLIATPQYGLDPGKQLR
jgi:hypothetical protein